MRKMSAMGRRVATTGVVLSVCAGMACSVQAAGEVGVDKHHSYQTPEAGLPAGMIDLMGRVPGVRADTWDGKVVAIYGVPMNSGVTADQAYRTWMADNQLAFGVGPVNVQVSWADEIDWGRFTVYAGQQYMDGLPVEFGYTRVLVLNTATDHQVVLASGQLVARPLDGFSPDSVRAADAVESVRKSPLYQDLTQFSKPEMVVYDGHGELGVTITPIHAWKFVGEVPDAAAMRRLTFFVDASTGDLVFARNEVLHFTDVTGTVTGWTTPAPLGNSAAAAALASTQRGLPRMRVRINGNNANSVFADVNGNFTIPWSGTTAVTVDASVGDGQWARVADAAGLALQTASATATPGTPVNLVLNATGATEFTTAQMNAFTYQTMTHDHWKTYAPTSTILDTFASGGTNGQLQANTQVTGTCNAFYNGTSTNFYNLGGGCNNTAFSNVISHENGHHIVNRLNLQQGGFGEGFGDTVAMMMYDDAVIGRFFTTGGGPVRTPDTDNVLYPCAAGGEIHHCGEILGNVVWEIRKAYGTLLGTTVSRELIRQQHVDWARVTMGGLDTNQIQSANPTTAVEWLTIDDNNGNISDGTPHRAQICAGFAQGGITCPALNLIHFQYPDGLPTLVNPRTGVTFHVNVVPGAAGTPQAGTGQLSYSVDGVAFTTVNMIQGTANSYTATIPAAPCGSQVRYYVSAQAVGGTTVSDPESAPAAANIALAGSSVTVAFSDDFETSQGWTVGPNSATTGIWERGDPNGTGAQPEDDHTPGAGVNCFFTGQADVGAGIGTNDVDNGSTLLTSPAFNASGGCAAIVEYWRWFSNNQGASPYEDSFVVDISSDGGTTWQNLETVGPGSAADPSQVTGGWIFHQVNLASISGLSRTSNMKVRFTASDLINGSVVEAAIDDFKVTVVNNAGCVADVDDGTGSGHPDGGVTIDDLLYYLGIFEAGVISADVDNGTGTGTPDGGVTIDDLLYFLSRYEAGC